MANPLAYILTQVTRQPRYRPEIVWSHKSWTHNVFRAYEVLFWRRSGIRPEASTSVAEENGQWVTRYELYTFEAVCAHAETAIRDFLRTKRLRLRVESFQFAPISGLSALTNPFISFAIALDVAVLKASTSTSPATWSHTVTGSNPLIALTCGVYASLNDIVVSSVTYAGAAATTARSDTEGTGTIRSQSFIALKGACATGANTVSMSFAGTNPFFAGVSVSYSGAQAGSTADASNGTSGTAATGAQTTTVTTSADNSWVVAVMALAGASMTLTSPTHTSRGNQDEGANGRMATQDTNAAKTPAGAVAVGWTVGGPIVYGWGLSAASFAPAAAAVGTSYYPVSIPNKFVGPMALRQMFHQPTLPYGSPATNTVYTSSLTGSVSFVAGHTKTTGKVFVVNLSFIGAVGRLVSHTATATLSFTGSVSKRVARPLFGGLTFVGTWVGSHVAIKGLTGGLSFIGSHLKLTTHTMTAALSFVGAVGRLSARGMTATLSFSGALAKRAARALTGSLSFAGTWAASHVAIKGLTGALSFIGAQSKQINKSQTAGLTFSGNLAKLLTRGLTGAVSFVGGTSKRAGRPLTGGLSFTGSFAKTVSKVVSGSLSFAGNVSRTIRRALIAGLTFTGLLATVKTGGTAFLQSLTGSLGFVGTTTKTSSKALSGGLSFSGNITKSTLKGFTASLGWFGNLIRSWISGHPYIPSDPPSSGSYTPSAADSVNTFTASSNPTPGSYTPSTPTSPTTYTPSDPNSSGPFTPSP